MAERIKTALEKALERAAQLKVSDSDLERLARVDAGRALAGRFLQDPALDLLRELASQAPDARHDVTAGVEEILLQNIALPVDEQVARTNRRAMEGITAIKRDPESVRIISGELGYLFDYYSQAYRHSYTNLKEHFEQRLGAARQMLEQQTGVRMRMNVERLPEFREEWIRTVGALNTQYESLLKEQKERLKAIPLAF
ncbi:MAG: hypothetical protein QMC81_11010 [Thermoanaerobacterales bacterium]|nr:hypothetical protein [Thermoanaerobacterales bacterium]